MIDKARQNNIEVIFVRHNDGVGNELKKGNEGFEIYEGFQHYNSEITLNVVEWNKGALELYKKVGFIVRKKEKMR